MAVNGQLTRDLDHVSLKRKLEELLINEKPDPKKVKAEEGKKADE